MKSLRNSSLRKDRKRYVLFLPFVEISCIPPATLLVVNGLEQTRRRIEKLMIDLSIQINKPSNNVGKNVGRIIAL